MTNDYNYTPIVKNPHLSWLWNIISKWTFDKQYVKGNAL